MSAATASTCRSCGAPIRWAVTADNKRIPLDAQPRNDGNIAAFKLDDGTIIARHLRSDEYPDPLKQELPFVSHFTTCPDAGRWRGSR